MGPSKNNRMQCREFRGQLEVAASGAPSAKELSGTAGGSAGCDEGTRGWVRGLPHRR